MKIHEAGHVYLLDNLDTDSAGGPSTQLLYFVKRQGEKYPGNIGRHSGTTSQEVLRALISRAIYVHSQIPCWQTKLSVYLMGLCVWLFEHRAAKRHHRKAPSFSDATYGEICPTCGHVGCTGHE